MSVVVWIGFLPMMLLFLHVTCSCIPMHHSFHISIFLSVCLAIFLFLSFLTMAPKKSIPSKNPISHCVVLLLLLLLLLLFEIGFVIQNPKRILMRTSITRRFIRNARLSCLISQTHLYPVCLALEVRNHSVRNLSNVQACLYKSSTPTYIRSIPLFLSLLRYSKEHVL